MYRQKSELRDKIVESRGASFLDPYYCNVGFLWLQEAAGNGRAVGWLLGNLGRLISWKISVCINSIRVVKVLVITTSRESPEFVIGPLRELRRRELLSGGLECSRQKVWQKTNGEERR